LHILSYERATDPEKFLDYFRKHKIDAMKLVPSHFEALKTVQNFEDIIPVKTCFCRRSLFMGTYRRSSQIKSELYDTESLWANRNYSFSIGLLVPDELPQHAGSVVPIGRLCPM